VRLQIGCTDAGVAISAFPSEAGIGTACRHFRAGPSADIRSIAARLMNENGYMDQFFT
jgi:hypothetical protein